METYTNHLKHDLELTQVDIIKQTGITDMDYAQMMFDTGIAFIETFARQFITHRDTVRDRLTLDRTLGFWDWWRLKWGLDDIAILKYKEADKISDLDDYPLLKDAMVGDAMLNKELYFLINNKI